MLARLRVNAFVALVAAASLSFELLQTRVLSALYFSNVVYMTVTIALLGFGISGVLVSLLQRRLTNPKQIATYCAAGLAISIVVCLRMASVLPANFPGVPALYKMIASYLVLVVPFLFAGGALSLTFMGNGKNIHELYFADLAASAAGAILFSLLLQPLGGPNIGWLCAAAGLAAFLLQAPSVEIPPPYRILVTAPLAIWFLILGQNLVGNVPEPYKAAALFFVPGFRAKLEASAWTPIARIDVWSHAARSLLTGEYLGHPSSFMYVGQDNDAPTMIHGEKDLAAFAKTAAAHRPSEVNTLAYFMKPRPQDVLVIGVGGGVDVVEARTYGAQNIDGAEINSATIDLTTKRFRGYSKWPAWDNIHIYHAEGRHFVRNSAKKYDVIVMHGVDTFAALNSGAYVLSENYLYTVEAMRDYLNALKPDGMMVIYRWFFLQPRESIRLANLFVNAAETVGTGAASQRIMVINSGGWAGTFIKRTPFLPAEVEAAANAIKGEEYSWIYVPKVLAAGQADFERVQFERRNRDLAYARSAYASLIPGDPAERAAFGRAYPYRIDPVYDDRPFFFEYYKGTSGYVPNENRMSKESASASDWGALRGPIFYYVLYILLIVTTAVCALGIGLPLLIFERQGAGFPGSPGIIAFFASLGTGFMFVEIGCMQWLNLYLGNPMYSLMVVLAGLLLFAGVGSLIAGDLKLSVLGKLRVGVLGTAVMIPAWLIAMKLVMPSTEHWPLTARIAVVLASLLPLGICMGIPFATGLRHLADRQPRFIPWAWGINGLTSVTASILAIILAMRFGFTMVVVLGSIVYALGYLSFWYYMSIQPVRPIHLDTVQEI